MFKIHTVNRRDAEAVEPLGTKPKFWFTDDDKRRMLFKAEERGTGEDWAEKIACHLCELLGMPHVHYELAEEFDGDAYIQPGVVCETCSPRPLSLVLGNQLLLERDPKYPATDSRKYKGREHSVTAVSDVMGKLDSPSPAWVASSPPCMEKALDFFVGYVMLDAWIANQDRHHENWGAIKNDVLRLAPTFDHGASLARNISDEERKERLTTNDRARTIEFFAARARSGFFEISTDSRPLSTRQAFHSFARFAPKAAKLWLEQLAKITSGDIQQILDNVPNKRMSSIAKKFTLELLMENQQELLTQTEEL